MGGAWESCYQLALLTVCNYVPDLRRSLSSGIALFQASHLGVGLVFGWRLRGPTGACAPMVNEWHGLMKMGHNKGFPKVFFTTISCFPHNPNQSLATEMNQEGR